MKQFLLIVLFALAYVAGVCQIPQTFTAQTSVKVFGPGGCLNFTDFGTTYVDSNKKWIRSDIAGGARGVGPIELNIFQFFDKAVEYIYNVRNKQCTKVALKDAWKPIEFPATSKFLTNGRLGNQEFYIYEAPKTVNGQFTVFGVTPGQICIPMFADVFNATSGLPILEEAFDNWYSQVDPFVFALPSACNSALELEKHEWRATWAWRRQV